MWEKLCAHFCIYNQRHCSAQHRLPVLYVMFPSSQHFSPLSLLSLAWFRILAIMLKATIHWILLTVLHLYFLLHSYNRRWYMSVYLHFRETQRQDNFLKIKIWIDNSELFPDLTEQSPSSSTQPTSETAQILKFQSPFHWLCIVIDKK